MGDQLDARPLHTHRTTQTSMPPVGLEDTGILGLLTSLNVGNRTEHNIPSTGERVGPNRVYITHLLAWDRNRLRYIPEDRTPYLFMWELQTRKRSNFLNAVFYRIPENVQNLKLCYPVESNWFSTWNTYSTQNCWVSGLCPSSGTLNTRKDNVSETQSVSVLWSRGETPTLLGALERANLNQGPASEVS
jgi:hypothetical protein